jgi:hypothetical protein
MKNALTTCAKNVPVDVQFTATHPPAPSAAPFMTYNPCNRIELLVEANCAPPQSIVAKPVAQTTYQGLVSDNPHEVFEYKPA